MCLALDDFGTGHSSLARLKDLPAHILKLDRQFITGLGHDPRDLAILQAVTDLARGMGHQCIAEGVKTTTKHKVLGGLGVDAYQSFLFSPAVPAPEFRAMLQQSPRMPR